MTTIETNNGQNNNEQNNVVENQPSAELKAKCSTICKMMGTASARDALLRYDIAAEVNDAMDSKYGTGAVEYIAAELGCSAANLYDYARVVSCWTKKDEFEQVTKKRTSKGMRLTFSHFVTLAKVEDGDRRQELLSECIDKSYSVRDLKERIDAQKAKTNVGTGHTVRPREALKKLVTSSTALIERVEGDIDTLAKIGNEPTSEFVEQLTVASESYAKTRALIEELEKRTNELLVRAVSSTEQAA